MASRPVVEITKDDIENAKPADSAHCMIAEALKRAVPEAEFISVDLATIRYSDRKRGKRYAILTPPRAQQSLLWFDQADPRLEPFEFKLPRPAQTVRSSAGKKRAAAKRPDGAPKQERAKLVQSGAGAQGVPVKTGGKLPPLGTLAGGRSMGHDKKEKVRTGRIRAFGLRSMAR